jgi:hypothetical protein
VKKHCLSACTVFRVPTTKIQVPSVEWLYAEDATNEAKALRSSKTLRRAALKYAQLTNRVPFFNQAPASAPTRPALNMFGRTLQAEKEATGTQAANAGEGATGAGEQAATAGQGLSQGPRSSTSRRTSGGRRSRAGDDEEEDLERAVERLRACSMCDRLRNATAKAVVLAHTLLGDPQVPFPCFSLLPFSQEE